MIKSVAAETLKLRGRTWCNPHLHREHEQGPFSESLGLHLDHAIVLSNDSFTDGQSKTNTFLVYVLVLLLQLAKALEELTEVVRFDASATVANVHDKALGRFTVRHAHTDVALLCELEGVLD